MRTRIPNELAGASLLGVHNWIKSQVALSNPGASPDYKLSDMSGNRLTLSDVAKNPGKEMMIEVETIQGVRRNPAAAITAIPGLEMEYPVVPRTANLLSEILQDEIDSAMAERVVAEQGLRAGLHSLNRMSIATHDPRITSPTAAALLQMGEIIRSNPSDRTPFTQRTPLIYSPERALAHWLAENSGEDIRPDQVKAQTTTEVVNASIASKYGLATDDIEKFAEAVLVDYLIAASANRALVRMMISRNLFNLKGDRETIHKLLAMFPQQASQFYNGVQNVFVAHPAFIYPTYAESILKDSHIKAIIKLAKTYPQSLKGEDKLPAGIVSLLDQDPLFPELSFSRPFVKRQSQMIKKAKAFWAGDRYLKYDNADDLDQQLQREPEINVIAKALMQDPAARLAKRNFKPLYYFTDLGGFYPSPPPKWPKQLVYAIMDTFLENLPYFLDVADPSKSNLTPVRMAYLAEPTGEIEVNILVKTLKYPAEKAANLIAGLQSHLFSAPAPPLPATYHLSYHDSLPIPEDHKEEAGKSEADYENHLTNLLTALQTGMAQASQLKTSRELTFDPSGPKSIIEMAYDAAEIAQEKYNYNMRGDDFKFVMAVVHYSLEAMKTHTPSKGETFSSKEWDSALQSLLGSTGARELDRLVQKAQNSNLTDDFKTGIIQQAVLAKMYVFYQDIELNLTTPMTSEVRQDKINRYRGQYELLEERLNQLQLSATFDAAARIIRQKLRQALY